MSDMPMDAGRDETTRQRAARLTYASVWFLLATWLVVVLVLSVARIARGTVTAEHPHGTSVLAAALVVLAVIAAVSAMLGRRALNRPSRRGTKQVVAFLAAASLVAAPLTGAEALPLVVNTCLFALAAAALLLDERRGATAS